VFGWVVEWVAVVFWVVAEFDGLLSPCSSPWFSLPITSCSLFSFIWWSYTYLGGKGTIVMVLPYFTMLYLVLTLSWIAFQSYCHGLPNKMWLACIGTILHRTSSTYFLIEIGTTTCLVTFTSPPSFSHCNLYGLACLTKHKFSLLTLTQLPLSIIKLHTLLCTSNVYERCSPFVD
jgi:hypothetical protein